MNRNEILTFLNYSEDARLSEDQLRRIFPIAKFIENKETDTQCFLLPLEGGKRLVIAFRGTQQAKDWMTDLDGFQEEIPYGNKDSSIRVHRGFIKAYKSVRDKIHDFLIDSNFYVNEINVCGHSLGGALATLCAVDMQYNYPYKKIKCYPSGNPKVGNKAFVDSYDKRIPETIRTYLRKDLVPELPPAWIEKAFSQKSYHTKTANAIGPKNIFTGIIFWFQKVFTFKKLLENLTNHSIELYKKYL